MDEPAPAPAAPSPLLSAKAEDAPLSPAQDPMVTVDTVPYSAPSEATVPPPPPSDGRSRLRVLVRETDALPRAGVRVRVVTSTVASADHAPVYVGTTDAEGAVSFTLEAGSYVAVAEADGIKVASPRIAIGPDQTREVTLCLLPRTEVTLRLVDERGIPQPDISVHVREDDYAFSPFWVREAWRETHITDAKGVVRFRCIAGIQLLITLDSNLFESPLMKLVLKSDSEQQHDVVVHRGREVKVRVLRAEDRRPLAGIRAQVVATNAEGHPRSFEHATESDAAGQLRIPVRRDHGLKVRLDHPPLFAGWLYLKPEQDAGELLVEGTEDVLAVLDGLSSDEPAPQEVLVFGQGQDGKPHHSDAVGKRVQVGPDRVVRIQGQGHRHAHPFRIVVPGYGESTTQSLRQPLSSLPTLAGEPMVRIEIVPYSRVRGRVIWQRDGQPASHAHVDVRRGSSIHTLSKSPALAAAGSVVNLQRGPTITAVRTDEEGRFEFLAPQRGALVLEAETNEGANATLDIVLPAARDQEFVISIDDRATCALTLSGPEIWSLHASGILVGEGPLAGFQRPFQTDGQGQARIERLPVGSYHLRLHRRTSSVRNDTGLLAGEPIFLSAGVTPLRIQAAGRFFSRE